MRCLLRTDHPQRGKALEKLSLWLSIHSSVKIVATYASLPGEVDLSALVKRHPNHHWAFPKVTAAGELRFYHVMDPARDLAPGAFGIMEPHEELPNITIPEIDAFLCPGIAFDTRGGRLGRGRGFYDRILASARPDAFKIGVCFGFQQVPDTFAEPHDVPMDEVIAD